MTMRDKILHHTNNGLDIFTHYVGDVVKKKSFCNPFREDRAPSCRLHYREKQSTGIYYMVDYGDSDWCGDCFTIAAKIKNLNLRSDFPVLLKAINQDLNLSLSEDTPVQTPSLQKVIPTAFLPDKPLRFYAAWQTFRPSELQYWLRYGISKETLERYCVRSLRSCTFYRQDDSSYTIHSSYLEPMYGYFFNEGKGVKVYRPFSNVRFMYAGTLPKPYIFGMDQLSASEQLENYIFITGGEKDVMTLASHGFCAIAPNSESAFISEETIRSLSGKYKNIVILYDCDPPGLKDSQKRVSEFGERYPVSRLVLPLAGNKKEKDISDFFRLGHTRQELIDLINITLTKN